MLNLPCPCGVAGPVMDFDSSPSNPAARESFDRRGELLRHKPNRNRQFVFQATIESSPCCDQLFLAAAFPGA